MKHKGCEVHQLYLVSRMPVDGTNSESGTSIMLPEIRTVVIIDHEGLKHKGHINVHRFCLVSRMVVDGTIGKSGTLNWWILKIEKVGDELEGFETQGH